MRHWKKLMFFLVVLAIVLSASFRVYSVNKGVPTEYEIERFSVGDQISLGKATLKVTNVNFGNEVEELYGQEWLDLDIEMEIENTSDETISALSIIESKLAFDLDVYQTNQGDFNPSVLQNLEPGIKETIKLTYNVKAEQQHEQAEIYLSQALFPELVEAKYKEGKRYGIVIELKD
jgi:hypothetical protein